MKKVVFTLLCLLPAFTCYARTIYVEPNGLGDYPTIQAAIDNSSNGDVIILSHGTYTGEGNRDIDFKAKAIIVRSTDPNDPNIVAATIIDCDGTPWEPHRGFYFHNSEDTNSVLAGFTITNACGSYPISLGGAIFCLDSSPTIASCHIEGNWGTLRDFGGLIAGGIYCCRSSPVITFCTITNNVGGGILCEFDSNPTITDCRIKNNPAPPELGCGGGISCWEDSNPTITNCTISSNSAVYGGGVYCNDSNPTITNCTIIGNSAEDGGGGVYCNDSNPTITNCTISGNSAVYGGGGICCNGSNPTITNCAISGNSAIFFGGGLYCEYSSNPTVMNCTISKNAALFFSWGTWDWYGLGGGIFCRGDLNVVNCTISDNSAGPSYEGEIYGGAGICCKGTLTITNCIISGNKTLYTPGKFAQVYTGELVANYSCVQGWSDFGAGSGNTGANPLLTQDGHLQKDSPCINAGDPNYSPHPTETDMDGEARIMNGRIDMGCDELLDTDSDGLPDWWEDKYFAGPTIANPDDDSDDDDWTNLAEYINATPPDIEPVNYYVDPQDGNDVYDGLAPEWDGQHGPKRTIQAAVDECEIGQNDVVTLKETTYTGDGNRDIDFKGKAITVRSTNPDDPCVVAATVIDCQGAESNEHRGFSFCSGEGPASTIAGLTITNGYAPFWWLGEGGSCGGAILCYGSSPTITNCIITNNSAIGYFSYGGGIYCKISNPAIVNCTIAGNSAEYRGGGICYYSSNNPTIAHCTISNNSTEGSGGAICCVGDEYHGEGDITDLTIQNSIISQNSGYGTGGIFSTRNNLKLINCIFSDNSGFYCGGVFNSAGSATSVNCVFTGNSSVNDGGAVHTTSSITTLTNCTLTGNSACRHTGGIIEKGYGILILTNCILRGNSDSEGTNESAQIWSWQIPPIVNYSCIQDWTGALGGVGNTGEDPCFVHPGYWADVNDPNIIVEPNDPNAIWIEGDYHLCPFSLCINAGDPNYLSEPNETDLDGNPRVLLGRIDMGAYESNHIEARLYILPRTVNRQSPQQKIMAWLRLPEGVAKDDIDSNTPLLLYPGRIEPLYQYIFPRGHRPNRTSIIACFDKNVLTDVVTNTGRVELKLVGRLKTDQYFYGTDIIRIKTHDLRCLASLASHWLDAECTAPDWCGGFDLDHDSKVDFADYSIFADYWLH